MVSLHYPQRRYTVYGSGTYGYRTYIKFYIYILISVSPYRTDDNDDDPAACRNTLVHRRHETFYWGENT